VKLVKRTKEPAQWAEQGGVGVPLDNTKAALWYRQAAASTFAGVYPRELRCFTVGWRVA
jgi:hypothetical protein